MLGPYYFWKYYAPSALLTCSHPLLLEQPGLVVVDIVTGERRTTDYNRTDCGTIAYLYNTTTSVETGQTFNYTDLLHIKRHTYTLCQVTYRVNDAIQYWKETNCMNRNNTNYARTFFHSVNEQQAIRIP